MAGVHIGNAPLEKSKENHMSVSNVGKPKSAAEIQRDWDTNPALEGHHPDLLRR